MIISYQLLFASLIPNILFLFLTIFFFLKIVIIGTFSSLQPSNIDSSPFGRLTVSPYFWFNSIFMSPHGHPRSLSHPLRHFYQIPPHSLPSAHGFHSANQTLLRLAFRVTHQELKKWLSFISVKAPWPVFLWWAHPCDSVILALWGFLGSCHWQSISSVLVDYENSR